jgi:hypothetical protein
MARKLRLGNSVPCRLSLPSGQIPGDPASSGRILLLRVGESVLAVVDGLDATDNRLEHIYNAAPSQDLLVILQNHRTIAALGPLLA